MLILTRKPSEVICIGKEIRVVVLSIGAGHIRLGIEAPRTTPVHRKEVHERIMAAENNKEKARIR